MGKLRRGANKKVRKARKPLQQLPDGGKRRGRNEDEEYQRRDVIVRPLMNVYCDFPLFPPPPPALLPFPVTQKRESPTEGAGTGVIKGRCHGFPTGHEKKYQF